MEPSNLRRLNTARAARQAVVAITDLDAGAGRIVTEGESLPPPLDQVVTSALRTGKSGLVEADGARLFLNVHLPPPRIVVIGAVHISQALARLASIAGYDLTIIDPRTAFATTERFAGVDLVADWPEDELARRPLDPYCALVAVTHDPKIDDDPLIAALSARCFYVGALGSRKTHAGRAARLRVAGISDEAIARISAPIGLDIGAATPAEIAVAILGEIIAAFRRRTLQSGQA